MRLEFYDDKKEKSDSIECHINFENKEDYDEIISGLENITGYGSNKFIAESDWFIKFQQEAIKIDDLYHEALNKYIDEDYYFMNMDND